MGFKEIILYWVTLVETFQNWSVYSLFNLIDPHPLPLNISLFTEITAGSHVVMTTLTRWEERLFQMANGCFFNH